MEAIQARWRVVGYLSHTLSQWALQAHYTTGVQQKDSVKFPQTPAKIIYLHCEIRHLCRVLQFFVKYSTVPVIVDSVAGADLKSNILY